MKREALGPNMFYILSDKQKALWRKRTLVTCYDRSPSRRHKESRFLVVVSSWFLWVFSTKWCVAIQINAKLVRLFKAACILLTMRWITQIMEASGHHFRDVDLKRWYNVPKMWCFVVRLLEIQFKPVWLNPLCVWLTDFMWQTLVDSTW